MEWVVTTAKTVDEAKDRALDQLGVAADEAEFEIVEEPRTGLFGRLKGEARVRARVKPAQVRPKQERRDRRRGTKKKGRDDGKSSTSGDRGAQQRSSSNRSSSQNGRRDREGSNEVDAASPETESAASSATNENDQAGTSRQRPKRQRSQKEKSAMHEEQGEASEVTPQEVGEAAVAFMTGLTDAMGLDATAELSVEDTELDVRLVGDELGLLVGPGGRTLTAVQDLARVASQRRLGDHDTRLRIDVGGYREKRRAALEKFAVAVAQQVAESGASKALEPMSSADRKAVHDAINEVDGVVSRSEGDDPNRRVVISPA